MTIVITISDIRTRYTGFADPVAYPDDMIQTAIDLGLDFMTNYINVAEPTLTMLAQLIVCHYLVFLKAGSMGDGGSISPLKSVDLGEAEIDYQENVIDSALASDLMATKYGQLFNMRLMMWQKQNMPWICL